MGIFVGVIVVVIRKVGDGRFYLFIGIFVVYDYLLGMGIVCLWSR